MKVLLEYLPPLSEVVVLISDSLLEDSVSGNIDDSGWGDEV